MLWVSLSKLWSEWRVAIMIVRPEGLVPSRIARRELHTAEDIAEMDTSELLEPQEIEAAAEPEPEPDARPIPPRRPQGGP